MSQNHIELFYVDAKLKSIGFEIEKPEDANVLSLEPCINFDTGSQLTAYSIPIYTLAVTEDNGTHHEPDTRIPDSVMPERSFKAKMAHSGHIKLTDENGIIKKLTIDDKLISLGEGELIFNHVLKITELHIYKANNKVAIR